MKRSLLLGVVVIAVLAVACGTPTPAVSPTTPAQSPLLVLPEESPIDVNTLPIGPAFTFNEPIHASDTSVSGTGGPNVPIKIIDVSFGGDELATGKVGPDGKFNIPAKLPQGHRIGIVLGDLAGTSFKSDDFIRGPGYSDTPMLGILFATAEVQ